MIAYRKVWEGEIVPVAKESQCSFWLTGPNLDWLSLLPCIWEKYMGWNFSPRRKTCSFDEEIAKTNFGLMQDQREKVIETGWNFSPRQKYGATFCKHFGKFSSAIKNTRTFPCKPHPWCCTFASAMWEQSVAYPQPLPKGGGLYPFGG